MRLKWITVPVFLAGLLALATVDSQGQPPGRERGGDRGPGDRGPGGPGRGGFGDPNAMWDRMAQGQDSINLNDPRFGWMKGMMERRGDPLPPNGILTKQQFVAGAQARMAQRGPDGGAPGRFTSPGGSTNTMTFQATPGQDGKPVFMMQGGPPGMTAMPGGAPAMTDEMMQNIIRRSDRNQDGRIDRDEASSSLRERFEQFDANRDGAIDANEYRSYIQDRMAGRGGDSRGPGGSFDPRNNSMSSQFPNGPGGWSPGGWGGSQDSRGRNSQDEEERPTVVRYGKLPKGLPSWFEQLDTDTDGQIGLYEWRRATEPTRPTSQFVELDLNADGYLTAGEWLRHQTLAIERRAGDTESGSVGLGGRGGPGQGGGMRPQIQPGGDRPRGQPGAERVSKDRGGDRPRPSKEDRKEEKKRNPFTGN